MLKKYEFFNEDSSLFDKFFSFRMKEGLIISLDYDMFVDKLKKLLSNYEVSYNISNTDEFVKLYIDLKDINHKKLDKQLYELIHNAGYFTSRLIDTKIDEEIKSIIDSKNNEFVYYFQKRFDIPKNTPDRLFHATTKYYYDKVKRTGLTAKTQNMVSKDLERLYLTDSLSEAIDFCTQKRFFYKTKYKDIKKFNMNIDEWVILEIDLFSIPDIKLYEDPKMTNSYYTYDFIPFYSMKVNKEINF